MSESPFSKAVATFSSAKKRYWTPSTKSAVYAAQAGVTLGLAIGAAAVGQTWVSGALAGAVVRASTKAYQSYKEGKKAAFEGAPVRGGSPLTGDSHVVDPWWVGRVPRVVHRRLGRWERGQGRCWFSM